MDVRVIAVDLDGTVLNGQKALGEKTLSALQACRARGIKVVVATARAEKAAARFSQAMGADGVISCGGALARAGDKTVYRAYLSADVADRITMDLRKHPGVLSMTVETDSGYFVNYDHALPDWEGIHSDFDEPRHEEALKLMADMKTPRDAEAFACAHPECVLTQYVGEGWCSMAHADAVKHRALRALLAYWRIPENAAAAFGDDANDMGMLQMCGYGVAMGNAKDDVKACARFVCPSNEEDGVGVWLYEHVMGKDE